MIKNKHYEYLSYLVAAFFSFCRKTESQIQKITANDILNKETSYSIRKSKVFFGSVITVKNNHTKKEKNMYMSKYFGLNLFGLRFTKY
ncbi:hypothetical protein PT2222_180135 [Paraburkholderia tropica]